MRGPRLVQALQTVLRFLERRVVFAPLVGVLLSLPAIGSQRVFDDHVLELLARHESPTVTPSTGIDLFQFASGRASDNLALMAEGSLLPWWTDPELKITFYRPLSSLLHRLDYALWPTHPELWYVHTLLWFGLLLGLVARLYARFEPRAAVASLAVWLFAVNDAHGTLVGWLSNRNAIVSAVGAVAALLAHARARRDGHGWSRLWAPLWLGVALLCGELGTSAWALLVAHALIFEAGPLGQRLRTLWPFALTTLAWGVVYVGSGAGTRASGVYLHPLRDLPAFVAEFPMRAAVLLGAAFGPIPAELSFLGPTALAPLWVVVAVTWVGAFLWLYRREVFADRVARFWCIAVGLGIVPVAASFPSDRLLVLVNVGAMALVARALVAVIGSPFAAPEAPRGALASGFGAALLAVHGLLAPLLLPVRAHQMQALGHAIEHAFAGLDRIVDLEHKTLLVLGAPTDFFVSYVQAARAARGHARPAHIYWLANPEAPLDVSVTSERSLSLARAGGFFVTPPEALYRRSSAALGVNARVRLPELTATVREVTPRGAPARIEFCFDAPLTDARYVFLALRGDAYVEVAPGDLEHLHLGPALPLAEFLSSTHER